MIRTPSPMNSRRLIRSPRPAPLVLEGLRLRSLYQLHDVRNFPKTERRCGLTRALDRRLSLPSRLEPCVRKSRRALVIGGSISGLFAGLLLRRHGWDATIFERSPVPMSGRGAGIMTHPELGA